MQVPCPTCELESVPAPHMRCLPCCDEAVFAWKAARMARESISERTANSKQRNADKKLAASEDAKAKARRLGFTMR